MERKRGQANLKRRLIALFAIGALAVVAVPAAQSTQGQPVLAGSYNDADQATSLDTHLTCASTSCSAFIAEASGHGTGVSGSSADGAGVSGFSRNGSGVNGTSNDGPGVEAYTFTDVKALFAQNFNETQGTAIEGVNSAPNWAAVYGHHDPATSGYGVFGDAPIGIGVRGTGSVAGGHFSSASASGNGVLAENTGGGNALKVTGKSSFTGKTSFSRSGVLTVATGATSVTKTGIPLSATSFVLATLQTNAAGLYLQGAVPTPATSSFKIFFSKAVPAGTKVAWIVMN